jgi:hypothetical protein
MRGTISVTRNQSRRVSSATTRSLGPGKSLDELYEEGKRLRDKCSRQSHAVLRPSANRPDPVSLLVQSSKGRIPQLIPVRYGRMMQSPFTFYRGAALNMAADLAATPATGLRVQACGDCHLLNFGAFATPERRVIFDINDLDETLPAPWEWDVKRLAASFVLACRDRGFSDEFARDTVLSCVRSYREAMAEFSRMRVLDVWYAHTDLEDLIDTIGDRETRKRLRSRVTAARKRSVLEHDFPKLAQVIGQFPKIRPSLHAVPATQISRRSFHLGTTYDTGLAFAAGLRVTEGQYIIVDQMPKYASYPKLVNQESLTEFLIKGLTLRMRGHTTRRASVFLIVANQRRSPFGPGATSEENSKQKPLIHCLYFVVFVGAKRYKVAFLKHREFF